MTRRTPTGADRPWSWDDPLTPPVLLLMLFAGVLGALIVGLAWVAS